MAFKNPACISSNPIPHNLWTRARTDCYDTTKNTADELAMRRKAEILKYKGTQNKLTKKQQYAKIVNGQGPLGKKVWANQNVVDLNTNINNINNTDKQKNNIQTPSSASDVPGNILLYNDNSVPLYGYQQQKRTFLSGGTKIYK
jgi:hypothetical protein